MCKCDGSCQSKITDEAIAKAVYAIFDKYDNKPQHLSVIVSSATYAVIPLLKVPDGVLDGTHKRVEQWIRNALDFKVTETENPFGVTTEVQRINRG